MQNTETPKPPTAKVVPFRLEKHGDVRTDNYYWLREREDPEVIAYLEQENAYTEQVLFHTKDLQEKLYDEIVARIPQADETVPVRIDGYLYYERFEPGKDYPIYVRRYGSMEAPEEVMIDVNELAEGHGYFAVSGVSVSPDGEILAFSTDDVGRRIYTLRFRNLRTGGMLPDEIPEVAGNVAWANDNRTIFYTKQDLETLRWHQIHRHVLGTDPANDVLVFEEADETFNAFVFRTRSKQFLVIGSSQTVADEYHILEADDPTGNFRVFEPRRRGREYAIDHLGDAFYIRTNDEAQNFRLMKTPVMATGRENWVEIIPHRDDVFLADFEVFRSHLVVSEVKDALTRLHVMALDGSDGHFIEVDEPAYVLDFGKNPDIDATEVRYVYSSLTTPDSTYDYDMSTRARVLRKMERVGGGYDPGNYVTERLFAPARDGRRIPISLVYRKGFQRDGSHPLYLYSYGSYGISSDPDFNAPMVSLLDRGFVFAIAHIRGGQELGREWYDSGKLLNKKNTFTDFIDAADYLIAERYGDPENMFASGGSAGGLLVGAVMNLRPDLFKGVVTRVPFVDVITTMLDEDIPLTTGEYDEWGNPNEKVFYDYMLSYSPYDHVEAKRYPNLLVTTGLHDSQVQYWEPAKWVAKLRAMKTGDELILLKTDMEAGHSGASGRFRRHRITALNQAFVLDLAGRTAE
ncbi:MAG TPA: S9 family peptidase [Thermoanaerobaculia bacterium]|nr:S9 family peptidase [Thermoanaerobaculia bacterium]